MKRLLPETTLLAGALALSLALAPMAASAAGEAGPIAGTVTRSDKGRIEVQQADGKVQEILVTAATVVAKGKAPATVLDVKAGAKVTVQTAKGKSGLEAVKVQIETAALVYTCPMHPEVQQPGPGKCPKCGMFLEKKG